MIYITILNEQDEIIVDYELQSLPYKVGDIIDIEVNNINPSTWDVQDKESKYRITSILHFLRKTYSYEVQTIACAEIRVEPWA